MEHRVMRKDNPACYECPKAANKAHDRGLHYWEKLLYPPGAICMNCGLLLNAEDARDVGFKFK